MRKARCMAGGPGREGEAENLHSPAPVEGGNVVTKLSDVQNCKGTLEIRIPMCILPMYKSFLNVIKY